MDMQTPDLRRFSVALFSSVMGLSGFTLMAVQAVQVLHYPAIISQAAAVISIGAFLFITAGFILKILFCRESVAEELNNPVILAFSGCIPVSFLLIATILSVFHLPLVNVVWWAGTVLQVLVTFYCLAFWVNSDIDLQYATPAWLIPVVGNLIVPFGGRGIVSQPFLEFFFSIGFFFWIILTPILLYRIIFCDQLKENLRPLLFIFIAPPAIAVVSYLSIFGDHYDFFVTLLYNVGLAFTFLTLVLYKKFIHLKFYTSSWAFIFPSAVMTTASIKMYAHYGYAFYFYLSHVLFMGICFVMLWITRQILKMILCRRVENR